MDGYLFPLTVEGNWSNSLSKCMKNKLQVYFLSKNKSSGGDCLVNYEDHSSTTATVYFNSDKIRENVLARDNHEITVKNEIVKLRVSCLEKYPEEASSLSVGAASNVLSDVSAETLDPRPGESIHGDEGAVMDSPQSSAVVLERLPELMSKEMLTLLVENISNLEENNYTLEIISETKTAVLTFNNPNGKALLNVIC
ncbi:hypothetical protein DPEC_G00238760 [Dallia pectoralis]|uniref:Uncharacterized protein n=1 Tax=Dallia pectoralis TaxID=75939 RepID=A0ACC2FZ96_DALPE|nr:hypothetical protein DPEC_G00238760 [Dallia pectoralis]